MKKNNTLWFFGGVLAGIILIMSANSVYRYITTRIYIPAFGEMPVQSKIDAIYNVLDLYYVDDYDKNALMSRAYEGLVAGLGDPYSNYMEASVFEDFLQHSEGTYEGIGVVVSVDINDNRIIVLVPYEGAPGARAGILPGDKIIKVDDVPVSGDMLDEAVSMMKGEPGTDVDVTIYRESDGSVFDVTITRAKISIPTVAHELIDGDVGYIKISVFDRVTAGQFKNSLDELRYRGMKGLILDLRDNPGGLLDVVVYITDMLVACDYIVYTENKHGEREYFYADAERIEVPLVVLVNGRSASASEILAGAVKDTGTGTLVGATTFGKGLVQSTFYLPDKSGVKTTIAKYYTPSGVCIDKEGIVPDYEVELPDEFKYSLSIPTEEDTQLQKAIEIIIREAAYVK